MWYLVKNEPCPVLGNNCGTYIFFETYKGAHTICDISRLILDICSLKPKKIQTYFIFWENLMEIFGTDVIVIRSLPDFFSHQQQHKTILSNHLSVLATMVSLRYDYNPHLWLPNQFGMKHQKMEHWTRNTLNSQYSTGLVKKSTEPSIECQEPFDKWPLSWGVTIFKNKKLM